MMQLEHIQVHTWAKLAWVAQFRHGDDIVVVRHGPCVEVGPEWCVEAIWAGDYPAADLDRTDLVFGSGLRRREGAVICVSAGSALDRLWCHEDEGTWHVANSLPALLAVARTSLAVDGTNFALDVDTLRGGLAGYKRDFACRRGRLRVLYFRNLAWDGRRMVEIDKPDTAPRFDTYETYAAYLKDTAERLAANMTDSRRTHPVAPLATLSQGYDSCAAAVVARHAGCARAATITQSTSLWRGSDSGLAVAGHLGMECATHPRKAREYPLETAMWAVSGRASVLNWALFDYPQPLCLLFTGAYGDKMWGRHQFRYRDPFEWTSISHGGIGEFRLIRGVFHCPVAFWGMRHLDEVQAISASPAMGPWSVGGSYDRPVARRLVEEAGVPRTLFGQRKKNTSHDAALLWPYSPEAASSFRRFLVSEGRSAPGPAVVWLKRYAVAGAHLVSANLPGPFAAAARRRRESTYDTANLLFRWANEELCEMYSNALPSDAFCAAGSSAPARPTGPRLPRRDQRV